jgi:hypothetical protein
MTKAALLVGPSASREVPFDRSLRYPNTIFSIPRSQFVSSTVTSQWAKKTLLRQLQAPVNDAALVIQQLKDELVLTPMKRPLGGGVGFFEQGILIGLSLFSTAVVATAGTLAYGGWIAFMQYRSRV